MLRSTFAVYDNERSPASILGFRLQPPPWLEADARRADEKEGNDNHDRVDEISAVELKKFHKPLIEMA
jgi:hypothetical protein